MQINAQKDNNENVMRINMTNMIYIDQYFMYIIKKRKPLLFMKIGALYQESFFIICNYTNKALTSASALLKSDSSGFQLHLISGSTTENPYLVNSSRSTFVDSPDQP